MLRFSTVLLLAGTGTSLFGSYPALAANECAKITNVEERLVCLEKKIDQLSHQQINLDNVRIRSNIIGGQCIGAQGTTIYGTDCATKDKGKGQGNRWKIEAIGP
jgi:hypothetical protein